MDPRTSAMWCGSTRIALERAKSFFFAQGDFTPFSPCSTSLTQEGVVEVDLTCLAKKSKGEKKTKQKFVVDETLHTDAAFGAGLPQLVERIEDNYEVCLALVIWPLV